MTIKRYDFAEDTMEPADAGSWVAYEDIAHLFETRSLRDYFAAHAMAAFVGAVAVSRPDALDKALRESGASSVWELAAIEGYGYADAMLAERSK